MRKIIGGERGQALAVALVALSVGTVLMGTSLGLLSTNLVASRNFGDLMTEQYSADAGVEDAIWNLVYGDLATTLTEPGIPYWLTETVNGLTASVTVTRDKSNIASDDFESGGWSGGSGWLGDWQGAASVTPDGKPHGGNYHLMLQEATGYVKRATNLSGQTNVQLQFWAKAKSFKGSDSARCLISSNGSDWTSVRTWTNADSDNTYYPIDIDLSPYTMSSEFWVAFDTAKMSGKNASLYIDDLKIVGPAAYEILSIAGGETVRATITIKESVVDVLSWQIE